MSIKRFKIQQRPEGSIHGHPKGDFVTFGSYEIAISQRDAEIDRLRARVESLEALMVEQATPAEKPLIETTDD